ncbi:hypothetical protein GLOIN_2v1885174 [Rhizophagus clarus]|uniref:Uncharacterized protein n=1 Tax=Rhizophagus clarus TaxID=94130 RepID=A0A8H3L6E8_9GLOM|nr:hypothetical protein GLOIN_2v1885174 [Rhizophagus clarus]
MSSNVAISSTSSHRTHEVVVDQRNSRRKHLHYRGIGNLTSGIAGLQLQDKEIWMEGISDVPMDDLATDDDDEDMKYNELIKEMDSQFDKGIFDRRKDASHGESRTRDPASTPYTQKVLETIQNCKAEHKTLYLFIRRRRNILWRTRKSTSNDTRDITSLIHPKTAFDAELKSKSVMRLQKYDQSSKKQIIYIQGIGSFRCCNDEIEKRLSKILFARLWSLDTQWSMFDEKTD